MKKQKHGRPWVRFDGRSPPAVVVVVVMIGGGRGGVGGGRWSQEGARQSSRMTLTKLATSVSLESCSVKNGCSWRKNVGTRVKT